MQNETQNQTRSQNGPNPWNVLFACAPFLGMLAAATTIILNADSTPKFVVGVVIISLSFLFHPTITIE